MKLAGWLSIGAVTTAGLASILIPGSFAREIWLGMTGPTVAVLTAWLVIERTSRRSDTEHLTAIQARLFLAKMLFFGAYVGGVLGAELARPYPFITAFTTYFVVLYAAHAFALHRLLSVRATQ